MTNNVGGDYNHTLFWESMTPGGAAKPARDGRLAAAIRETFGSFAGCAETIKQAALSQLGLGWAWLVCDGYRVLIVTASNQDSPFCDGLEPLLGVGAIARGWGDLADTMKKRGDRRGTRPGLVVEKAALELWIIPPDRSMAERGAGTRCSPASVRVNGRRFVTPSEANPSLLNGTRER